MDYISTFPTPYYHIEEAALLSEISLLKDSLTKNWGNNHIMGYSVKTNSLPWLLTYLKNRGFYAEIVSETEYQLVTKLGYSVNNIIYNGPIKNRDTFSYFLQKNAYLNMDSNEEIEYLEDLAKKNKDINYHIGLRVNCDIEKECPGETLMGSTGGRFGYCFENGVLQNVVERLKRYPNIHIAGLHMHSSSQLRTLTIFAALARAACNIASTFQLNLNYIDMGGGYYGGVPDKPNYADYFEVICKELKTTFHPDKTTLIVEPGVSLISSSFTLVTTVKDIKDIRGIRYVITDGSRLLLNPQVTRHEYPHHLMYQSEIARKTISSQWICGFTCMEYDRLFECTNTLELHPGDQVVYDLAGGYTITLAPLFIRYFPAVYVKHTDNTYFTAREEWGVEEFLQKNHTE